MRRAAAALLLLALSGVSLGGAAGADVPYEVEFVGAPEGTEDQLEAASRLVELQERPPGSEASLRRRAEDDLERLRPVVHGAGYWGATLAVEVTPPAAEGEKAKVVVRIEKGPLYKLETVTFQDPAGGTPPVLPRYHPSAFGLELGGAARSAPVLAAEGKLVETLGHNGYPWAKVSDRKVVVDHGTDTMAVTYTVEAGAPADFGTTAIEGLERLDAAWVARRIAWSEGAPYDSTPVEATRKALADSGLFASIRVAPGPAPAPDGSVPMTITLAERAPRSIGAGIQYNSSEGFGARAFWEHRNLFGYAEKLRVTGDFAQQRLGGRIDFRRPDALGLDADFVSSLELAEESPPAYDVGKLRFFNGIEEKFSPAVTGGYGIAAERLIFEEGDRDRTFTLLGVPTFLRRDTTDDLLDPTSGTRLSLTVTPWSSLAGPDVTFFSAKATASAYQALDEKNRYVLAGFAGIGTILGPARDRLPPDKRLYAGGGGSVRGYGFQMIGPVNADDRPQGGKGSVEAGVELRIKITDTIGVAPFLEMGMVNESSTPLSRPFFGAGLGFRYFTPIGPVRLDVGVPLNKRDVDDAFQVYISLGQAF
jgi:translocation and assembly module TamA